MKSCSHPISFVITAVVLGLIAAAVIICCGIELVITPASEPAPPIMSTPPEKVLSYSEFFNIDNRRAK